MTITNSVVIATPGQGSPILVTRVGVALVDGANTITLPSTGSLAPTCRVGTVRVKIYSGTGTSPAVTNVKVTLTDGTTTEQVADDHPGTAFALTSNQVYDYYFEFIVDINATSCTVTPTLSGTSEGASCDVELAYSN